jgi:hypothetical protein
MLSGAGIGSRLLLGFLSFVIFCRAENLNKSWVALNDSRGVESLEHKLFMRYSGQYFERLTYNIVTSRDALSSARYHFVGLLFCSVNKRSHGLLSCVCYLLSRYSQQGPAGEA